MLIDTYLDKSKILRRAMALQFYKYLNFIGVKQKIDKDGFKKLGCPEDAIKIMGDLKYDVAKVKVFGKSRAEWLAELGLASDSKVLLGGSWRSPTQGFS